MLALLFVSVFSPWGVCAQSFNSPPPSPAGGDVTGPSGATQSTVPVFSDATGKALGASFATLPAGNGELVFRGQMVHTQCMQVASPGVSTLLFFRAATPLTVASVSCITVGGTSVSVNFDECDSAGDNCATIERISCGIHGTVEIAIDDPAIAQGAWMKSDITAVDGVVAQVAMCVSYIPSAPVEE